MTWTASGTADINGVTQDQLAFSPEFDSLSDAEKAQVPEAISCANHLAVTKTVVTDGDVSVSLSGSENGSVTVSVSPFRTNDKVGAHSEKVGAATGS